MAVKITADSIEQFNEIKDFIDSLPYGVKSKVESAIKNYSFYKLSMLPTFRSSSTGFVMPESVHSITCNSEYVYGCDDKAFYYFKTVEKFEIIFEKPEKK